MEITSAHFFASGGSDVSGFRRAGLTPVMAVEINPTRWAPIWRDAHGRPWRDCKTGNSTRNYPGG